MDLLPQGRLPAVMNMMILFLSLIPITFIFVVSLIGAVKVKKAFCALPVIGIGLVFISVIISSLTSYLVYAIGMPISVMRSINLLLSFNGWALFGIGFMMYILQYLKK